MPLKLFLAVAALLVPAHAAVCSFDDLPTEPSQQAGTLPANYCGFNVLDTYGNSDQKVYFSGSWYGVLPHSAPNALLTSPGNGGLQLAFTNGAGVTFSGFWVYTAPTGCWSASVKSCGAATVGYYQHLNDGNSYSGSAVVQPGTFTFIASGYNGTAATNRVLISYCGVNGYDTCADPAMPLSMSIDDISFTGICLSPSLSPPSPQIFPTAGGTGSISVTENAGCSWSVSGAPAWLTINSGGGGTGNGTVRFTVAPNSGLERQATLSIGAQSYVVDQNGTITFTASDAAGNQTGVLNGSSIGVNGTGWPSMGGKVSIYVGANPNPSATFSPPSFESALPAKISFDPKGSPPCTIQIKAVQGTLSRTVTLSGSFLGKLMLADNPSGGAVFRARGLQGSAPAISVGDAICADTAGDTPFGYIETVVPGAAAVFESNSYGAPFGNTTEAPDVGGGVFSVADLEENIVVLGNVDIGPGKALTLPLGGGRSVTLPSHASQPMPGYFPLSVETRSQTIAVPDVADEDLTGYVTAILPLFVDGSMKLDNAALYAESNLSLLRGLSGNGGVFAYGDLTIAAPVNLTSDFQNALLSYTGNIIFKMPEPGDANHDGVVNCADYTLVKGALGATPGSANWSPALDMNADGVVSALDLAIVTQNLPAGTKCQ